MKDYKKAYQKQLNEEVTKPTVAAEKEILEFWKRNKTLEQSIDNRPSDKLYTFFDGPITANNLPHSGHALTMTLKDVVPRYWTMRGYKVPRSLGWDCQGIPVEYEVEKTLGFKAKEEIEEFGVAKFNQLCRESVEKYSKEIMHLTETMGRWVNKDEEYATMNPQYIESIWWSLKELYNKNLLYEGYKVVPYSTRAGTPLSNSEVALGGYKEITDPAVTIKFFVPKLGVYALAWTTTPWTLPGNLLLAVGPDFNYAIVDFEGTKYLVGEELIEKVFGKKLEVEKTYKGSELAGLDYEPLYNYYLDRKEQGAFKFVTANHVTLEDGTGIVHQAPYGEEDFNLMIGMGIKMFDYLDNTCNFTSDIPEYEGLFYKQANKRIIEELTASGKMYKHEDYVHKMPMCWRTDTPLIYKPIKSWYVAVTKLTKRLVEENKDINWVPEHIRDGRFGNWLAGARDWALSRKRYWGTPLPVWINDKTQEKIVIGSFAELQKYSGIIITDPHRPFVDEVTWTDEVNGGTFRRIEDVIDVWYDSGAMPFARLHYPFENKELFAKKFPGEFIAEGIDQTRGWFYTLHVLGVALFDSKAFKNVVVNGMALAADGTKMSKSKKNYTPPGEILDMFGADSLRMYLLSSPIVSGEDILFVDNNLKEMNSAFALPLLNLVKYFLTYVSNSEWTMETKVESENIMDKWIGERLKQALSIYNSSMEVYDLQKAAKELIAFVDDLSKWYIRRSRDRFVDGSMEAISTLYAVLNEYAKMLAPFAPYLAERVYFAVNGLDLMTDNTSVHLQDLDAGSTFDNNVLVKMEKTREMASIILSLRESKAINLRQPLSTVYLNKKEEGLIYEDILMNEVKVKTIKYFDQQSEVKDVSVEWNNEVGLNIEITEELKNEGLGNELGRVLQVARKESGCQIGELVEIQIWTVEENLQKTLSGFKDKVLEEFKVQLTVIDQPEGLETEAKVGGNLVKLKVVRLK